jgi:hypothetical protein
MFVVDAERSNPRIFKTAWFSRAAKKARIKDDELCQAMQEAMNGQADDLGGGVYKKRLNKNKHRSGVLAKGGKYWIYVYLFAKQDRKNIEENELTAFRKLANLYAKKAEDELEKELNTKELVEICRAKEIQK